MATPVLNLSFFLDSNPHFNFESRNFYPQHYILEKQKTKVIIFGSPILGENINKEKISIDIIKHGGLKKDFISSLNGEFLIVYVDIDQMDIQIANDRFTSIPLYYYFNSNSFKASTKYIDIAKQLKQDQLWELNNNIFFEFLWFRRIHGDKTYDKKSTYLKSARIISFNKKGLHKDTYWTPNFNKDEQSNIDDFSNELALGLSKSVARKTSDIKDLDNIGLFLSGGMDTRTLLGVFTATNSITPTCYTIGYSERGEYRVAKKVAEITGSECRFIKLSQDYYSQLLKDKSDLAGGMYNQFTNIFVGHKEKIEPYSNILFHGHGLDYMFQGMYIPAKYFSIFGKNTHLKSIMQLNDVEDIASHYVHNVNYRFNQFDISNFLLPNYQNEMIYGLYDAINEVLEEGRKVCNDNFDLWEYLLVHTISRHYSQMDISGMGTNGEQRKVANDNDLMNLYLKMPLEYRKDAKVMRAALRAINPKLADLESANTGYRIDASPFQLTSHFIFYKILRTITGNQKFRHPGFNERTWPNSGKQIKDLSILRNLANDALNSEMLHEELPYLDWEKIKSHASQWIENESDGGGNFLMHLMSVHSLLKEI